jgi:class 3 adenylate cyclase
MSYTSPFDLKNWLAAIGCESYFEAFTENDVDQDVLSALTVEDLKELGVRSIGHRRRILEAAKRVKEETEEPQTGKLQGTGNQETPEQSGVASNYSGERRNLTVMFCDLMDSTALSVNVDPEDFRDFISKYRKVLEEAVSPYEGHIAQFLGDGIFVYFGYPKATESHAEKAIAAGLAIVGAIQSMEPFGEHQPKVRIGVATGLTVVNSATKTDELLGNSAVGEIPNLAARLQGITGGNEIIVSTVTRDLFGQLFDCDDLGKHELKGFSHPVTAWRVVGRNRAATRFHALRSERPATEFVGREQEMIRLRNRLAEAKAGHGQFAVIVGDGGLGKSRLARQIVREASNGNFERQPVFQCAPYDVASAFHPIRSYIYSFA